MCVCVEGNGGRGGGGEMGRGGMVGGAGVRGLEGGKGVFLAYHSVVSDVSE